MLTGVEPEVCHVSLVPHEALAAVIAPEGKVSGVPPLMTNQFVSVAELLLAEVAGVPEQRAELTNFSSIKMVSMFRKLPIKGKQNFKFSYPLNFSEISYRITVLHDLM